MHSQTDHQSFPRPFTPFSHHFGFNLRQRRDGFLICFHGAFARVGLWLISFVRNQTHSCQLARLQRHGKNPIDDVQSGCQIHQVVAKPIVSSVQLLTDHNPAGTVHSIRVPSSGCDSIARRPRIELARNCMICNPMPERDLESGENPFPLSEIFRHNLKSSTTSSTLIRRA